MRCAPTPHCPCCITGPETPPWRLRSWARGRLRGWELVCSSAPGTGLVDWRPVGGPRRMGVREWMAAMVPSALGLPRGPPAPPPGCKEHLV